MTQRILTSIATGVLLALASSTVAAQNLAIVNGKPVPSARAEFIAKQLVRQGRPVTPEIEKQIKDYLIGLEIASQEAASRGLDGANDFKLQMQIERDKALAQQLMLDVEAKTNISDDEARAEYNKLVAANSAKEYLARHILVDTEAKANAILSQLKKKGAKFETLAKQSKDPESAANGGLLDWAVAARYVKEFGDALQGLQKNETTAKPVKTQFGFHIIRLEDVRTPQPPKFDEVKVQLIQQMKQQKIAKFQESLREKAKIE